MKRFLYIAMMFVAFTTTSCVASMSATIDEDGIYETSAATEIYYDDSRWVGYDIVWINDWPYWYGHGEIIPYHHHHTLVLNNHYRIVHRPYKPILRNNRFHPRYQGREYHNNRTHYGRPNHKYDAHNPKPIQKPNHSDQHTRPNNGVRHNGVSHNQQYRQHSNTPRPNAPTRRHEYRSNSNTRTYSSPTRSSSSVPSNNSHSHSGSRPGRR